jgi:hypothetical protein
MEKATRRMTRDLQPRRRPPHTAHRLVESTINKVIESYSAMEMSELTSEKTVGRPRLKPSWRPSAKRC